MTANISTIYGIKSVEVDRFLTIGEQKCFVHCEKWDINGHNGITWKVSEYSAGYFFSASSSKEKAIKQAKEKIKAYGDDKFLEVIRRAIDKTGIANK